MVENSVSVKLVCFFDSYECFRNHCCYSRFYSERRCVRFCEVPTGGLVPRVGKRDFSGFSFVVSPKRRREVIFRG
jgi:hypothetical protein